MALQNLLIFFSCVIRLLFYNPGQQVSGLEKKPLKVQFYPNHIIKTPHPCSNIGFLENTQVTAIEMSRNKRINIDFWEWGAYFFKKTTIF